MGLSDLRDCGGLRGPEPMTNEQIIVGAVIYCAAAVSLVVAQYHAPEALRPFSIIKRTIGGIAGLLSSVKKQRSEFLEEDRRRTKENDERNKAFRARPCERCGTVGRFRINEENRLVAQKSTGEIIIQIVLVLFILTPLTCGLGIICLLFIRSGKRYQLVVSQECIACGFVRPYH